MEQADKKAGLSSAHTRDVPPFIQVLYDVMMDPGLESVVKWNHPQPGFVVCAVPHGTLAKRSCFSPSNRL
jgi:hypothetical protein